MDRQLVRESVEASADVYEGSRSFRLGEFVFVPDVSCLSFF